MIESLSFPSAVFFFVYIFYIQKDLIPAVFTSDFNKVLVERLCLPDLLGTNRFEDHTLPLINVLRYTDKPAHFLLKEEKAREYFGGLPPEERSGRMGVSHLGPHPVSTNSAIEHSDLISSSSGTSF